MSKRSHFFLIGRKELQMVKKSGVPIGTGETFTSLEAAAIFAFEKRMTET